MRDVCRVIIVLAGGFMVVDGDLSPGTLVAFLFYVGIYLDPIERLTRTNELIQKMAAGTKSFFALWTRLPKSENCQEPSTWTGYGGTSSSTT
jgi:ATP-binding cassette subfamily B protein